MRSFLSGLSLKRRITLSVAFGLAFILATFGYITMWSVEQSTEQIYHERELLARTTARYVDGLMMRVQKDVTETSVYMAAQGGNVEARKQVLAVRQDGGYSRMAVLDNSGRLLWQEPSSLPAPDVSSWTCVQQSEVWKLPSLGTVLNGARGRPAGCVAVPMPDGSGMLVAETDPFPENFRLIPSGSTDGSLLIDVVDKGGAILASSDSQATLAVADHMFLLNPLVAAHISGVKIHSMPDGSPRPTHLVAYAPMSSVPDWGITVEQAQDVALALPYNLEYRIFILGAAVILLGSVLAWTDVRRMVQPLEMLTLASARMAAGDLETPITTNRRDELGDLARTFDVMRVKLNDSLEEIGRWNRELEQRVRQRTQDLSALFEASQTLTQTLGLMHDRREMYSQLTAKIAQVVGADKCLIALLGDGDEVIGQDPGHGVGDESVREFRYRAPALRAPSILSPEPALSGESSHGRRFLRAFGGRTVLAVPLQVEARTVGVVFAGDKPGGFNEDDARLLSIVAGQAAVAVENARLYAELQQKEEMRRHLLDKVIEAQEEERKRISRELHDDVGQALTALVMNLGGVEESMPSRMGALRRRMAGIRDLASDTLSAIRRLMLDLRPTLLDDLGLIPAISWYAENNLVRANIRATVKVAGFQGRRLPVQLETVLFRVIQEAITNIVKHSAATEATIHLELVDGHVRVVVEDNGKGFESFGNSTGYEAGLGLMGMGERVALFGGHLTVETRPGQGTILVIGIPVGEAGT